MFKDAARKLSRNVWFWRSLPARQFGRARVLVSPSSHLAYWLRPLGRVHGPLFDAAVGLVRPGGHVWDIGANVGTVSVACARLAGPGGRVLSVEADCRLVGRLRRTARDGIPAGEGAAIEVLPAAVSDRVDVARFNISSFASATNALAGFGRFPGVAQVDLVCAVTLDWLFERFGAPDVIKIDVEGAEALVLRGGRRVLAEARPALLIEIGDEVADEVTALLDEAGYVAYPIEGFDPGAAASARSPMRPARADVVAVPRGRPPPWAAAATADAPAPAAVAAASG